jgi:integrase
MASIKKRPDGAWRARYRDPSGKEHAAHFDRKVDGERWIREHAGAVDRGTWIDPAGARRTVKEYAEQWRMAQMHRPTTAASAETLLRLHVYPTFGDRQLGSVRRSDIQAWVSGRIAAGLAPSTVRTIHCYLAAVFRSAVEDRLIPASPCSRIALPKGQPKRIEPMTTEAVERLAGEVPVRYRALIITAAGTGLRQGEALGMTVDRIDFLRRTLTIDRQLVTMPGRAPYLAEPKTQASSRVIPLPQVVVDALAVHLAAFRAGAGGFVFTTEAGEPISRSTASKYIWNPAAKRAGLAPGVTFHDLRHYFASLLIRHGESVKTVQARLGHASASETLDTYSHLWPDSDDRTREAVDAVLGGSNLVTAAL